MTMLKMLIKANKNARYRIVESQKENFISFFNAVENRTHVGPRAQFFSVHFPFRRSSIVNVQSIRKIAVEASTGMETNTTQHLIRFHISEKENFGEKSVMNYNHKFQLKMRIAYN